MALNENISLSSTKSINDRIPSIVHSVKVSGGFNLHVEEVGDRNKPAALYIHGGWGPREGEGETEACAIFDPEKFRVIFFHQRGWGRSTPTGKIEDNFLENSIEDCETVREFLDIDNWKIVYGGSNGATLALAYAACFGVEIINGLILRGLWLIREEDLYHDYGSTEGKAKHYPREFETFLSTIGMEVDTLENDFGRAAGIEIVRRYLAALLPTKDYDKGDLIDVNKYPDSDELLEDKNAIARAWLAWDTLGGSVVSGLSSANQFSSSSLSEKTVDEDIKSPGAFLTSEYEIATMGLNLYQHHNRNNSSCSTAEWPNEKPCPQMKKIISSKNILELAEQRLKNMPLYFITGEFDMLCPPKMAYEVASAIFGKDDFVRKQEYVRQVRGAAHSARDPGMKEEIKKAVAKLNSD